MATVKALKAQAKAAGVKGFSSMNKGKLLAALGLDAEVPKASAGSFAPIGMPNNAEGAGLTEVDLEAAAEAAKAAAPPRQGTTRFGIPTQKKRGGVTSGDMNIATAGEEGAPTEAPAVKPGPSPSHTGQPEGIGVPTEPERGGVNKLERQHAGKL